MKIINKNEFVKHAKNIVDSYGVSSREHGVVEYLNKNLNHVVDEISSNGMGNLTCKINSSKKDYEKLTLLIDTHMDELGLMIVDITNDGFLKFVPIGGWWEHSMLAQRYSVITKNGQELTGIIGGIPIHILPKEKRTKTILMDNLYLDIGVANKKEAFEHGVEIGSIAVKTSKSFLMANSDYFCGKAIDNRISTAILFYLLNKLEKNKMNLNVVGVFAAQEEVGLRGAKSGAYNANPDVAIVIDTTISHDQLDMSNHNDCKLNNGFALEILDATVISNPRLLDYVKNIANKYNIPYSYSCLTGGGTDGGYVYRARKGVLTIVLGIPTRYLHTHNEICSINDALNCIRVVGKFIEEFTKLDYDNIINGKN